MEEVSPAGLRVEARLVGVAGWGGTAAGGSAGEVRVEWGMGRMGADLLWVRRRPRMMRTSPFLMMVVSRRFGRKGWWCRDGLEIAGNGLLNG